MLYSPIVKGSDMNDVYYDALARLDKDYPPPKQLLTLREACDVLSANIKTIQNKISLGTCPFPVVRGIGHLMVSKHAIAALVAGLNTFDLHGTTKKKFGRPKNSVRIACGRIRTSGE